MRSHEDDGKSGMTIEGRFALQQLVKDVQSKPCGFQAILVYDVSRWGRFQDSDEAAHYEYLCTHAGVKVIYCAEQFENDGTPVAAIVKGVKRAMAGEYSRELSVKVFAGQCRLVRMGYRQGGSSKVFGYRSLLVDIAGNVKGELMRGERKCVQTHHVVLALGKDAEAATVQRIFDWFVSSGVTEGEIAKRLNAEGTLNNGKKWDWAMVHYMLTNEVYIGSNVFNKKSAKLGKPRCENPPEKWVWMEHSHPPLISLPTFMAAQQRIAAKPKMMRSREELLQYLREMLAKHKRLTTQLSDAELDGPYAATYCLRFGSLVNAYRLIGYLPKMQCVFNRINRMIELRFPEMAEHVARDFQGQMDSPNGIEGYSLALARAYSVKVEELLGAGRTGLKRSEMALVSHAQ